jgi:N-acetylmuramoyl-L-alanine amidase
MSRSSLSKFTVLQVSYEVWYCLVERLLSRYKFRTLKSPVLRACCRRLIAPVALILCLCGGCARSRPHTGEKLARLGDEIVVCGQLFHTGTPVVLWMDPGGYDAYRVERRFAPFAESSWEASSQKVKELKTPNRYGLRNANLSPEQIEKVRGGGWDLPMLQDVVDQFVLHYDVSGTSRQCFNVLHDHRCLSVHFMLDLDGTIYQTLDLKERAWHATTSNTRSVGIEIANIGAYADKESPALKKWYSRDEDGRTRITIPERLGKSGIRTPNFVARPSRNEMVSGTIQGQELYQYDLTPQQYESLKYLTAALCKVFPKIHCDFPHDESGEVIRQKLPDDELKNYQGLIGHYHIQTDKVDPGPALQWKRIIDGARELIKNPKPVLLRAVTEE